MKEREIIKFYIDQGILLSPELLLYIKDKPFPLLSEFAVLNKDALIITEHHIPINIDDYEKAAVLKEKHHNIKLYERFQEYILNNVHKVSEKSKAETDTSKTIKSEIDATGSAITELHTTPHTPEPIITEENLQAYKEEFLKKHRIRLVMNYREKSRKRNVQDFVNYFNARYRDIERILRQRSELQNLTSLARISQKKDRENVALIGIVYDKQVSKNNNIILTMEDPTAFVRVIVNQNKEELFQLAQEIQLDEIIGITGMYDKFVFANHIIIPDIPLTKELKKSPEEGYFVVISDPQIGNKLFLEKEFNKLISWLNAEQGNDAQKEMARKVKYLFIVGDVVDGVGIYPDQEYDLNIIDVRDQYAAFAELLKKIPPIPVIICPGNHDVGRMSEPQPGLNDEYSKALWSLPNVVCVSNPSTINIYGSENFDGFDVLLYHGGSFFYYFYGIPSIRQKGGPTRSDLVMRYLLQRRHLAPTHTSSLYIPDPKKDPLVIDKIPDFFFTGHVHRATVNNYRNITCINASCWVSKSEEQERRGLDPQPGRAFVVDMQTREVKIMNFLSREEEKTEEKREEKASVIVSGGING